MSSSSTFPDARSLSTSPSHVNMAKALGRNSLELVDSVLGASIQPRHLAAAARGGGSGCVGARAWEGQRRCGEPYLGSTEGQQHGTGSRTSGARRFYCQLATPFLGNTDPKVAIYPLLPKRLDCPSVVDLRMPFHCQDSIDCSHVIMDLAPASRTGVQARPQRVVGAFMVGWRAGLAWAHSWR
uniref:Uncharacterized protein n=1 Tax=Oryza barthii TaxID=65489 RepID=A0A0D3EMR5_9ORYZ